MHWVPEDLKIIYFGFTKNSLKFLSGDTYMVRLMLKNASASNINFEIWK